MGSPRSIDSDLQPIPTLERLCGAEIAGQFHDAFAGMTIRVPKYPAPGHPLVQAIGQQAANLLASECGGDKYEIPINRDRRAIALFAEGKMTGEVARALCITMRGAFLMKRRLGIGRLPKVPDLWLVKNWRLSKTKFRN